MHKLATGAFDLRRKHTAKHTPTRIRDTLGKTQVALHVLDVQLLNGYQPKSVDQPSCCLMQKVMAAKDTARVDSTHYFPCLTPFLASALLLAEFTLCFGQCFLVLTKESGVRYHLSVGQSRKLGYLVWAIPLSSWYQFRARFTANLKANRLSERGKPVPGGSAKQAGVNRLEQVAPAFLHISPEPHYSMMIFGWCG